MVQFVGLNLSSTFVNPSDTDDCPRYVEKSLAYLIQVSPVQTSRKLHVVSASASGWLGKPAFCFIFFDSVYRPICAAASVLIFKRRRASDLPTCHHHCIIGCSTITWHHDGGPANQSCWCHPVSWHCAWTVYLVCSHLALATLQ